MLSTLLILALMGTQAFAADIECVDSAGATADCEDADKDGFPTNPKDTKLTDCKDDVSANQFAAIIHPGAKIAIGDLDTDGTGGDSDCDGTDDDAELAAALEAAGGEDSPKGKRLAYLVDECVNEGDYASEAGTFVWSWETATGYGCHNLPEGWGYSRTTGVQSRADRAALGAARSANTKVELLVTQLGSPGSPAVPATDTTPAVEAVPATGLYLELAELEAAMAKGDADTKAELATAKAALEKRIGETEASVTLLKSRVSGLEGRMATAEADINGLYGSAPIYRVSVAGLLYGGRSLYEFEGGPMVRSGVGGGAAVIVTTGYGWEGHALTLDLGFTQGGQGSGDASLPLSLGFAAVGHQWVVGDLAVGPEGILYASAMGNPLDPTVSSWGLGGGARGAYFFALPDPQTYLGIEARVDVAADSFGTNSIFDKGPGVIGTVGLTVGRGPER